MRLLTALYDKIEIILAIRAIRTERAGSRGGAECSQSRARDRARRQARLFARVIGTIALKLVLSQIVAPPGLLLFAVAGHILHRRIRADQATGFGDILRLQPVPEDIGKMWH